RRVRVLDSAERYVFRFGERGRGPAGGRVPRGAAGARRGPAAGPVGPDAGPGSVKRGPRPARGTRTAARPAPAATPRRLALGTARSGAMFLSLSRRPMTAQRPS